MDALTAEQYCRHQAWGHLLLADVAGWRRYRYLGRALRLARRLERRRQR